MTEIVKKLRGVFLTGLAFGLLFGVVRAISATLSQKYFFYRTYYLFFLETVKSLNEGLAIGALAGISVFLVYAVIRILGKTLIPGYLEVRIVVKKKLKPLVRLISLLGLAGYLLLIFLQTVSLPSDAQDNFLLRSLIALGAFFLIWLLMSEGARQGIARMLGAPAAPSGRKIVIIFVCLLGAANLASLATKRMKVPQGPNVLVVVADALRADHLGCYGYAKPTSPNIDQFAAESLVFENAMSNASWTKPSIGSLFTSLYPHRHGALYMLDRLENSLLTAAEAFRNAGYATVGIQKNFCVDRRFNFDQGFETFIDAFEQPDEFVLNRWKAWIARHRRGRFFAYLHFMNTHVPFISPSEFDKRFIIGENVGVDIRILTKLGMSEEDRRRLTNLYDQSITAMDRNFQSILESLRWQGLWETTIVVFTADHGEELWDHGSFEHGHTLYNEVLHVPLVLRVPVGVPARRLKGPVQLFDLFPSLFDLTGIRIRSEVQGKNFAPFLRAGELPPRPELFFEGILFGAEKKAVLKDGWKLIENTGETSPEAFETLGPLANYVSADPKKGYELYRQVEDFGEQNDLAGSRADVVDVLKRTLQPFKLSSPRFRQRIEKASSRDIEKLKSLGYIK